MSTEGSFVSVFHNNYAEDVTKNFKLFLDSDLYIDLIFVCRNNKKVGAHQVVLGCLSKFFYSIFIDNLNAAKDKVIYIYVPDIRAKMMKYILQFIYCGKAMLNKEELNEFNEDIKLLGMPLDLFQPLEDTTPDVSKVAGMSDSVPNSTNEEVPINTTSSATVDLTAASTDDQRPSILPAITGLNNNESIVSSSDFSTPATATTVAFSKSCQLEVASHSQIAAPISQAVNATGLPVISSVCALESRAIFQNVSGSTSNEYAAVLNSHPENFNLNAATSGNQLCNDRNRNLFNSTTPNQITYNIDPSLRNVSPTRKRKKSNASVESNKRVVEACINLDASDDDAEVITIT